ncbi:DUF4823 domain-containing protein [Pseudomonas sp. gcc21]|uniref:DUF4823 domain-containing protein n=1 Tax=Pseudomonas sp. gcc21 TaxID=2726989 RepID=UPI00145204E8|nr:DUF4823 domain-containing protein [Pseudomonas sp. gcc21]QJD58472.1 DUF4823 domain-containing protein [Pseudomonas sp. gcc21]
MRWFALLLGLAVMAGCMKPSDMRESARYYLDDAGLTNNYRITRSATWTLQSDSSLYIAQGHFVPVGHPYSRPNVVAEEAFAAAVQLFPLVQRAHQPAGLDEALSQAQSHRADYLLYTRFASAQAGDAERSQDQWGEVGIDEAKLQLILMETSTRRVVDFVTIETRGGFLQFFKAKPSTLLRPPLEDYTRRLLGR